MVDEARSGSANGSWLYYPAFAHGWPRRRLWPMAQWVNGLPFRDTDFGSSGLPVIKIAEIKAGITDQTKYTANTYDELVRVRAGDMLFSWSGQPDSSIDAFWWRGPEGWLNQHVFRVTPGADVNRDYFFYLLRYLKPNFVAIARNKQTTGLGHVTKRDLESIEVGTPPLSEQRAIAHILGTLDDKIELNRRTSATLEELARALFTAWFVDFEPVRAKLAGRPSASTPGDLAALFPARLVESALGEIPEGWRVDSLDRIARFLNGLALQKYPPTNGRSLPVIKIAQLRAGATDGADAASADLDADYVVDDGDILFSWSGSLECVLWAGGKGALNQHLFRVTSADFPKWFCYLWIHQYLDDFRQTAAGKATTMGHIQRYHLAQALVTVPPAALLSWMNRAMTPLVEASWRARVECRTLASLRDTLVPRLISGELRVAEAKGLIEEV